jgi:tetratricopeptide (TPR) repeat protein
LAGRKAEKAASFNDAIAHAKKRVRSLEKLPQGGDIQRQIIDARVVLGLYIAQMCYYVEAKEAIDPIIDLAIEHNHKRRLCQIYGILGTYHFFVKENFSETFKVLEEALKISEEVQDIVSLVLSSFWLGCALGFNCEFEKSANYFQKALDINLAVKNLWGIAIMRSNLAYFSYYFHGKIDLAFKNSNEGLQIAEGSGDIYPKTMAYLIHGASCDGKGSLQEAQKYLLKGLEFCERINLAVWDAVAQFHLGETYLEMGDFERSKDHYEKGIRALERNRLFPSVVGFGRVGFERSKVLNREKDVNLESLYPYSRNNRARVFEGWIQRYIGEILLNIDDQHISEAEHWVQKAIEADQRNQMMFHLAKDYALYSDLLKRKGDRLKARENLGKAIEIFKGCGADGWVTKAEKELATIS